MEKTKGEPLLEAVKGIATQQVKEFKKLLVKNEPDSTLGKALMVEFVKLFF